MNKTIQKKCHKEKTRAKTDSFVKPYRAEKVSKQSIHAICTANSTATNVSLGKIINGSKW